MKHKTMQLEIIYVLSRQKTLKHVPELMNHWCQLGKKKDIHKCHLTHCSSHVHSNPLIKSMDSLKVLLYISDNNTYLFNNKIWDVVKFSKFNSLADVSPSC